jgi:hypothetical protein
MTSWDRVKLATADDRSMLDLTNAINGGFLGQVEDNNNGVHPYSNMEHDMNVCDGVVLHARKVMVPLALVQEVLSALHPGHTDTTTMMSEAVKTVFWPEMVENIIEKFGECKQCNPDLQHLRTAASQTCSISKPTSLIPTDPKVYCANPTHPPLLLDTPPRTASCLTPHSNTEEGPGQLPSCTSWQYWSLPTETLQHYNPAVNTLLTKTLAKSKLPHLIAKIDRQVKAPITWTQPQ